MTLHPFFQIQVGDFEITTVPPEFVQSITYKSTTEGLSTFDFSVVDPTYSDIEQILIGSDANKEPIVSRFGYLNESGQAASNWIQSRLIQYSPRMTHRGTEITASCLVDIGGEGQISVANARTKVYAGRRSEVVKQVAADLGLDFEVEDTDDDSSESDTENRGGPRLWNTRGLTPFRFIREELLPEARSKTGQSNYECFVTGARQRNLPPVLHFHTKEYPNCVHRRKGVKEFTYLAGSQDQVLEFVPTYSSSALGNLGGGQVVMRSYDFFNKRFVSSVQSSRTNPDTIRFGNGNQTISVPLSDALANEDLLSQAGFHMLSEQTSKGAIDRARNRWELLKSFSFTASLTLVGLPDLPGERGVGTTDIEANDLVRVNVLIPNFPASTVGPPYRKHWTSGLYLVTEAIHEIGSRYIVQCELRRDQSDLGAAVNAGTNFTPPA